MTTINLILLLLISGTIGYGIGLYDAYRMIKKTFPDDK